MGLSQVDEQLDLLLKLHAELTPVTLGTGHEREE